MLLGAAFTVTVAWALGRLLLDRVAPKLDRMETRLLAFVLGSVLLAAVTALARFGGGPALGAAGALVVTLALLRPGPRRTQPAYSSRPWRMALAVVLAAFGTLYLLHAMMPEIAPDGQFHHLGDVVAASQSDAALWPPVQLLYLFAFTFGGHAAPALVHLAFLFALALLLAAWGRREGRYKAGVVAAVLVFASPVAGLHGSTAAEDVAVAAMLFAAFYLMRDPLPSVLPAAGAILSMAAWQGGTRFQGMPGPGFLLAPLALVALRWPAGRLVLAAGCGLLWFGWMPALPFLALALGMALERSRYVAPVLVAAHAVLCGPDLARFYTRPDWRIGHVSLRAALRLRPETEFLKNNLPGYQAAQLLEHVPRDAGVYSLTPLPRAYLQRDVLTSDELNRILRTPVLPELQPRVGLRLRWAAAEVTTVCLRGQGTIHELRLFDGERELPREGWRLRSEPDSRGVQNAFDNSPVTSWSGTAITVEFGRPQRVSEAAIACPTASPWRVELDGKPIAAAVEEFAESPPAMRRVALYELRLRGIGHLLVTDDDPAAPDLLVYPHVWGLRLLAAGGGAHLLKLEPLTEQAPQPPTPNP